MKEMNSERRTVTLRGFLVLAALATAVAAIGTVLILLCLKSLGLSSKLPGPSVRDFSLQDWFGLAGFLLVAVFNSCSFGILGALLVGILWLLIMEPLFSATLGYVPRVTTYVMSLGVVAILIATGVLTVIETAKQGGAVVWMWK